MIYEFDEVKFQGDEDDSQDQWRFRSTWHTTQSSRFMTMEQNL
jgi:hypothetical protein